MDNQNNKFEDSSTYQNLQKAFRSECETSAVYSIYGERAKEEGYDQIGCLYEDTARNEREHAKLWLKLMEGGELSHTMESLKDAYKRENEAWTKLYIEYAEEARKEGYIEIAWLFEAVAGIERHHEARFRKLLQNITDDLMFRKKCNCLWVCTKCGYLHYGESAPSPCKVCGCPQCFHQLNKDNF